MSDSPNARAPVADSGSIDAVLFRKALATQKDDYLRLAADFDNFRKRTQRDSEQRAAAEKESFIRDLLPVLDNLERALACGQSVSPDQLRQGVEMTLQQLSQLLQRNGIEVVEDVGRPFDPHRNPLGRGQLAVFPSGGRRTRSTRMTQIWALRSRLEKQPTDLRQSTSYFGDRTLGPVGGIPPMGRS
jgi:hypothetical protein